MEPPLECGCGRVSPPGTTRCACGAPLDGTAPVSWRARLARLGVGEALAAGLALPIVANVLLVCWQSGTGAAATIAVVDAFASAALVGCVAVGAWVTARLLPGPKHWWAARGVGYGLALLLVWLLALGPAWFAATHPVAEGASSPVEAMVRIAGLVTGVAAVPLALATGFEAGLRGWWRRAG